MYKRQDLIVLDVNLPDGNGFDLCRDIKIRRPDTAVIFLTANDMESDMLKGYELGADDYVTKPFPISVFQKKASALLARIRKQSGGDHIPILKPSTVWDICGLEAVTDEGGKTFGY